MVSASVSCGEHDDRPAIAALAHLLAGLLPVHVRQPDIEQHQVHHLRSELFQAGRGGGRIVDLELVMQRELLLLSPQCIIIVNDENLLTVLIGKTPGTDGQVPA